MNTKEKYLNLIPDRLSLQVLMEAKDMKCSIPDELIKAPPTLENQLQLKWAERDLQDCEDLKYQWSVGAVISSSPIVKIATRSCTPWGRLFSYLMISIDYDSPGIAARSVNWSCYNLIQSHSVDSLEHALVFLNAGCGIVPAEHGTQSTK